MNVLSMIESFNTTVEVYQLDRTLALGQYENQVVELEGYFIRIGNDKNTGLQKVHVLIEDINFKDINGSNYNALGG